MKQLVTREMFAGSSFEGARFPSDEAAIYWRDFLEEDECESIAKKIYKNKGIWTSSYEGEQFSLGLAWYTFEETDTRQEYRDRLNASNAFLQREFEPVQEKILNFLKCAAGTDRVRLRPNWGLPAFVIFPENELTAKSGGDIHIDYNGLNEAELDDPNGKYYSFVCLIESPGAATSLRIWNKRYRSGEDKDPGVAPNNCEHYDFEYTVGGLLCFDSLVTHQILPFDGTRPRVCLTFHVKKSGEDWLYWF